MEELNEVKVSVFIDRRLAYAFTSSEIEEILWRELKEAERLLGRS